ncbi:MAG: TVP38/TMEM64 family protein [Cyclobacteriaceae bacterium]|nr:TVP38/TMEM64 family protein [Cyclobacteriaceae bacterium]
MNGNEPQREVKQSKWPLFVSLILIAVLVASYFLIPDFRNFLKNAFEVLTSENESRISGWVNEMGIWGPIFIVVTMVLQMFLLVIPSPLLMVVSVLAYGPFLGAFISIIAVFSAPTVGYWIGRLFGLSVIFKLIGSRKEKKIEHYVESYGYWAVIITRLAPMLSNDAISFVGGILEMKYWKFIGATLIGITPLAILIAYFGENNDRLKTGLIWTSVISLVLFAGYIVYDHRRKHADWVNTG